VKYPYFPGDEPLKFEVQGSYAVADPDYRGVEYGWIHSMSEIVNSLIGARLQIASLREYPFQSWKMFPFMQNGEDGWWRLPSGMQEIPLIFSLRAKKSAAPDS
jgi:hypothetical protein